jgi:hypothetical protein
LCRQDEYELLWQFGIDGERDARAKFSKIINNAVEKAHASASVDSRRKMHRCLVEFSESR